jgi:hypothetical protein
VSPTANHALVALRSLTEAIAAILPPLAPRLVPLAGITLAHERLSVAGFNRKDSPHAKSGTAGAPIP